MGQKGRPKGFRLAIRKNWDSIWFADKASFGPLLLQDIELRRVLRSKSCCQGSSRIVVRRMGERVEITIHTARPGLVIGKKGSEIDSIREEISQLTGKEVSLQLEEIKHPDLDASLVAEGVSRMIERRISHKRAMKRHIQVAMDAGAVGIRVQVSGRLGGAEIARMEWYLEGSLPLHTLRCDIDYACVRAMTVYGVIGVQVWINRGEYVSSGSGVVPAFDVEKGKGA
ncbi:30S ribosomal protein S3 [Candidatus Similichlamydia epinepheli]|uniref:30S ribosomal protein S3 n=1 Tax=Candidatus Similichlamydia epinepheli TaxID=1903953 RepID=UPI000D36D507|nr:30S ribosomal protein S3 [Candidatus Similichlamydia epinepheli]